jgi:eukaryotic-like serine/threonine-protein kinase
MVGGAAERVRAHARGEVSGGSDVHSSAVPAFTPPLTLAEVEAAFAGAYQVEASVQTGGQGTVFRARAEGRCVALKIYHADQLEERLAREMEALRNIRGPTLVELHDAGTCSVRGEECRFLATTFIEGKGLDAVLAAEGAQPIARVARIGRDVAVAVREIWSARIVHRDIKPNNVMLTPDGRSVLIDLGVARHVDMTSLTSTGKTWGTHGYLSPEQARGAPLTCKSDVFALGVLLQECILGRHPTGRRQDILLNGAPKTAGLRDGLPAPLVQLLDAMVHRGAVHRPLPERVAAELGELAGNTNVGEER